MRDDWMEISKINLQHAKQIDLSRLKIAQLILNLIRLFLVSRHLSNEFLSIKLQISEEESCYTVI